MSSEERRLAEQHAFLVVQQAHELCVRVQRGELSALAAVHELHGITDRGIDRIVRVEPGYRPDIQTSREGDK